MINKILLTGGHAGSTAYALSQTIREKDPKSEVVFVGAKSAVEGKNIATLENTYLPKLKVRYIPIICGRLQRKFTRWTILSLIKVPVGFLHAILILYKEKPSVTVSFGGYAAFPVVFISWIMGIPVIMHEQTIAVGRANRFSSFFAKKIALARRESEKYFQREKTVLTGNPLTKDILQAKKNKSNNHTPTVLITGGSRGSVTVNNCVRDIIGKLIKEYDVYHQTGSLDFPRFEELHKNLPLKLRRKYNVYPSVDLHSMAKLLVNADILVSRSGANTVSEAVYLKLPSIFVPLPFSYLNEQYQNAEYAKRLGIAVIIKQSELTPELLYKTITTVKNNKDKMVKNATDPVIDDSKAAEKLYDLIEHYAKKG